jgi:hypothetical protein
LVDSQQKYSLTAEQVQCGHCKVKALMRIVCEGEDSYVVGDVEQYGGDDVHDKWQVVKCPVCCEINVLQHSSSSLWDYEIDDETFPSPVYTTFLYPSLEKEKPLYLKISNQAVEQAIADVEALIPTTGAVSGVDRIHTALHGYLGLVCVQADIEFSKKTTV